MLFNLLKTRILFLILYVFSIYCTSQNTTKEDIIQDSLKQYFRKVVLNLNKNNTTEAIQILNKAYEIAKNLNDETIINKSYFYYSTVYKKIGNYEKSEYYYKKVIRYYTKKKNYLNLSVNHNSYADLLIKMNKENEAKHNMELALKYAKLTKLNIYIANSYCNLSQYYFKIKNYPQAKILAYKAYTTAKQIKKEYLRSYKENIIGVSAKFIGISEIELKNYDPAKAYLEEALVLRSKRDDYQDLANLHNYLNIYYSKKNNINKAYYHQKQQIELLKKINTDSKKEQQDILEKLTLLDKNTHKLELAEKEIENHLLLKQLLIVIIIFISIIAGVFVFFSLMLKRKNKILKLLEEQALDSSRKKSEFINMITHELRTPLYTIHGTTNLLKEESGIINNLKSHFSTLFSATNNLLGLINNIINYTKLDKKALKIETTKCNLHDVINNTLTNFKHSIEERKNSISLDFDNTIPKIIYYDRELLGIIFFNLISNANKFTEKGNIQVKIGCLEKQETSCKIQVNIIDDGIGIPADKQKHILEPFLESSQKIDKKYEGSGLGLNIVQQLLNKLGTTLKIISTPKKGSNFSFTINCNYEKPSKKALQNKPKPLITDNTELTKGLSGKKILVVEDNKINQLITVKTLKKVGVECDTADNGLIAVNKCNLQKKYYDLIFMDIHMPVMDGYEATLKIKAMLPNMPIIALTAVNIERSPENLKKLGLTYSVNKPFSPNVLYHQIALHVGVNC